MAILSRNRALVGSLISAAASVAVAFVGVLPRLREQDHKTIAAQQTRLEQLAQQREQERETIAGQQMRIEALAQKVSAFEDLLEVEPSQVRWTISGRIKRPNGVKGQGQYEVYLVPGNKHLATPSDDGRFVFEDFFPGSYALIVRDLDAGSYRAARGLITRDDPTGTLPLETHGAWADYKAVPQSAPTAAAAHGRPSKQTGTALAAASLPTQNGGLP